MAIALEESVALFSQPVFSEAFNGILEAIAGVLGNDFANPEKEEIYEMLVGASVSYVSLRNRVADFKKRAGIPSHIPLAKSVSAHIHRNIFGNEPLLPDYLAYLGRYSNRRPDAINYANFKVTHQKN